MKEEFTFNIIHEYLVLDDELKLQVKTCLAVCVTSVSLCIMISLNRNNYCS